MRKARSYDGHPIDADRLFSPCILNYGMHSALMGRSRSSFLLPMSAEQRIGWMESFQDGETPEEKRMGRVAREAVAEVEAWECIERVRHAPRKPGRSARAKGGAA
jgi:hypothetical protein